ncbi:2-polyprenyl-6-methoxyphenol hydroxylase-like FAD-dependent oxidoreductase [Amycolatopsis lexingtonensis]|uniref:2-polyprenyl-6-methoxyphenol hydroxylase-like FAD-dependent oxidoreductase n=1 Tax=Amycolatopsis lexingtonensis TaxID=218822 RepID=A0ABR9IAP4_9PSEU|nr:FAD-dependent oxidoreductase [Amycolatopsis lexingtonensis]MBE1500247.1 2-polyprenyl-6-methoxyphenol hydroxylase-like FAD-dependent oxidoreductase [Amycolatopsis lexingtonensis]
MRNILISGAGVAGSTLAWFLARDGWSVTVVERAPGPRTGGQAIDVRGAALDVVDEMGLGDRMRALRTRMRGMSMVDGQGQELFRSEEYTYSSGRLDNDDFEVLRDDVVAILHEAADVEYVFGDAITALTEEAHGVRVEFEHGGFRTFDLVVGADGLHSAVRRLAFGPEEEFVRHLGQYLAIFPAPNFLGLEDWQVWFRHDHTGGVAYPVRDNTELRVTLGFGSEPLPRMSVPEQKRLIAERLGGVGWEVPKLLEAMAAADVFYFDAMAQIELDRWSSGRIALVGDAGYCASALSGQGTSLALVGAYVLAQELGRAGHEEAFAAYERRMRPFVALNQALATENPEGGPAEESVDRAKNAISLA